jgi:hypothetical protein
VPRLRLFLLQGVGDPADRVFDVAGREKLSQHLARLRNLLLGNQMARRLRNREEQREVQQRQNQLTEIGPAPGRETQPERLVGTARKVKWHPGHSHCAENAADNRELLQRAEPAAETRGRDFGDVGRRRNRREADADTADEVEGDEHPYTACQSGAEAAHEERRRRELHQRQAADPTADPAGPHRSDRRTQHRRRRGEAQQRVADVKAGL